MDYHSGVDFGHEESRDSKVTKGRYHVLLPDGRMQNVNYWADATGYHAKVTYSDVSHHWTYVCSTTTRQLYQIILTQISGKCNILL